MADAHTDTALLPVHEFLAREMDAIGGAFPAERTKDNHVGKAIVNGQVSLLGRIIRGCEISEGLDLIRIAWKMMLDETGVTDSGGTLKFLEQRIKELETTG